MSIKTENDASMVANEFEITCPRCTNPVMQVDGSALAGVLLDDFEHSCGFPGRHSLEYHWRLIRAHTTVPLLCRAAPGSHWLTASMLSANGCSGSKHRSHGEVLASEPH